MSRPPSERMGALAVVTDRPVLRVGLERWLGGSRELCRWDVVAVPPEDVDVSESPSLLLLDAGISADCLRRLHDVAPSVLLDLDDRADAGAGHHIGVLTGSDDPDDVPRRLAGAIIDGQLPPADVDGHPAAAADDDSPLDVLTPREQEVIAEVASGRADEEIARRLRISTQTVRSHAQRSMAKLGLSSRLELVALHGRATRAPRAAPRPPGDVDPADRHDGAGRTGLGVHLLATRRLEGALLAPVLATGATTRVRASWSPEQAVRMLAEHPAGTVVVAPGGGDGPALCAALRHAELPVRILVIGGRNGHEPLRAALEAGADGYLGLDATPDQLLDALARLPRGEAVVPPPLLGGLLRDLIHRRREEDRAVERFARLSRSERRVLALLVEGLDQDAMAERLFVSPNTVRTHVHHVLKKLEVHSRVEAAALAVEHDLVERFASEDER